jgi:hypothetical protein
MLTKCGESVFDFFLALPGLTKSSFFVSTILFTPYPVSPLGFSPSDLTNEQLFDDPVL